MFVKVWPGDSGPVKINDRFILMIDPEAKKVFLSQFMPGCSSEKVLKFDAIEFEKEEAECF